MQSDVEREIAMAELAIARDAMKVFIVFLLYFNNYKIWKSVPLYTAEKSL